MKTTKSLRGPEFYDNDVIFTTYMARRGGLDNPNDTLEKPVLLELVGDVAGKRILDLGCGDAAFGREALAHGCIGYVGVEGSRNMVAAAEQTLADTAGEVVHADLATWIFPRAAFELVISRLTLHYLADFALLCTNIYQALVPGGRFVFSVEHPVITSCDRVWRGQGPRQEWLVDNYFASGERITRWLGGEIIKYHRTVEEYFLGLQQAGFVVEQVRESRPQRQHFTSEETYQRRLKIPLFLLMAGKKPRL
jgi:SAM-dependent methyltransferase